MDAQERGELYDTVKAAARLLYDEDWRNKLFRKSGTSGEEEIRRALDAELDQSALEISLDNLLLILKHFPDRASWEAEKLSVLLWKAKRKRRRQRQNKSRRPPDTER